MDLIKLFIDICLFRRTPQDVPQSVFLFRLVLSIYLVVSCVILALQVEFELLFFELIVQAVFLLSFIWGCLALGRLRLRFLQTMTAVLASDVLISCVALPVLISIKMAPEFGLAIPIILGLMFWQLLVMGHILRSALETPFSFGIGLAVLFFFLSYRLMSTLFPVPG